MSSVLLESTQQPTGPMNAQSVKTTSINLMLERRRVSLCYRATIELVQPHKSTVRQENLASVVQRNVMTAPTDNFKTFLDELVVTVARKDGVIATVVRLVAMPFHPVRMKLVAYGKNVRKGTNVKEKIKVVNVANVDRTHRHQAVLHVSRVHQAVLLPIWVVRSATCAHRIHLTVPLIKLPVCPVVLTQQQNLVK